MIILKFFYHISGQLIRYFYWLYNLSRIKGLRHIVIYLPIIVEGKGKAAIGAGGTLNRKCSIRIANQSQLIIGKKSHLGRFVDIQLAGAASLVIGDYFECGSGTRIYLSSSWRISDNVVIATNCAVFSRESGYHGILEIGYGTHIGDNTIIDVSDDVLIGENVAIGPNCVLYTHDHDFNNQDKEAAWKGSVITKPIKIENGAWIGSGVTILSGIIIGERAVVAAGAVVTKNVLPRSVVGGVPAVVIRNSDNKT